MPKHHLIELTSLPPEFHLGSPHWSTILLHFFHHVIFSLSMVIILNLPDRLSPNHNLQKLRQSQQTTSPPTSHRNWKPSERSSQLPTTCFQMYNSSTSVPLSFSIPMKASFLLPGWDQISLFCSPFPQTPHPINYLLFLLHLLFF